MGGVDHITGDAGEDILIGGAASDTLYGNNAANSGLGASVGDILIGDGGEAVFFTTPTAAVGERMEARSLDPADGAGDQIHASNGNNLVIGGYGGDTITAGGGDDLVMGDNGEFLWSAPDVLDLVQTTSIANGGSDDIRVGDGENIVLGGFGADVIETGVDTDLILGDNGFFQYTTVGGAAILTEARTTDNTDW